jgi:hypothetical protein
MEEFFSELNKRNIKINCMEVPSNYKEGEDYNENS